MSSRTVTEDALFGGGLTFFQPAAQTGYRVNVDALLLGAFAARAPRVARLAVDLGAGAGAVGLTLLHLGLAQRVAFVERDAFMAELCTKNLAANALGERGAVYTGDLTANLASLAPELAHAAALVVANPPYVASARDARLPAPGSSPLRRSARHGELEPFVRAAAEALGQRGRACFVYPAHALVELFAVARGSSLEPKRLRFVHGRTGRPARIALVEFAFGKKGGLVVETPLVEVDDLGQRTPEVAALLTTPRRLLVAR